MKLFVAVIGVLFFIFLANLKSFGIVKKIVNLPLEVNLVDVPNQTARTLVDRPQAFNWDPITQRYKICIGELTPTTSYTTCVMQGKVTITHYLGTEEKTQVPMCFYVDVEKHECNMGDLNKYYYLESDIIF